MVDFCRPSHIYPYISVTFPCNTQNCNVNFIIIICVHNWYRWYSNVKFTFYHCDYHIFSIFHQVWVQLCEFLYLSIVNTHLKVLILYSNTSWFQLAYLYLYSSTTCKYHISSINTASSISTTVWYYLRTNNIDIVLAHPRIVLHATLWLHVLRHIIM